MPIHRAELSPESHMTPDYLTRWSGAVSNAGRKAGKSLVYLLGIFGLVAAGYWVAMICGQQLYQAKHKQSFAAVHTASSPSVATSSGKRHPPRGSDVALLTIPRLGVSSLVVEGAGERELRLGPGHMTGTSLPGEGGNIGIAGHRDSFFRPLRLIRRGDQIELSTTERAFHYHVVSTRIVSPEDVSVLRPNGTESLTLITCYPFHFVGAAPQRFIVRAACDDCAAK